MVCTNLICKGLQQNLCNAVLWACQRRSRTTSSRTLAVQSRRPRIQGSLPRRLFIISVGHICSFRVRQLRRRGGSGVFGGGGRGRGRGSERGKKGTHFFLSTVTRKVTVGVSSHLLSSALLIGRWKWKWWIITDNDFFFFFLIRAPHLRAGRVQSP